VPYPAPIIRTFGKLTQLGRQTVPLSAQTACAIPVAIPLFHGAALCSALPTAEFTWYAWRMPSGGFLFGYWAVYAYIGLDLAKGVDALRWRFAPLVALCLLSALISVFVFVGRITGPRPPAYHDHTIWPAYLAVLVLCFLPSATCDFGRRNVPNRAPGPKPAPVPATAGPAPRQPWSPIVEEFGG